jgi:hypothetical protein
MADQEGPPPLAAAADGGDEPVVEVPKRNQTPKEPPVTFREFDVSWRKHVHRTFRSSVSFIRF